MKNENNRDIAIILIVVVMILGSYVIYYNYSLDRDEDGDGLTYIEELSKGTDDYNPDNEYSLFLDAASIRFRLLGYVFFASQKSL